MDESTGLEAFIRDVADFPKPGIVFKDITPLLADPTALARAVEGIARGFRGRGIDLVASPEARGFIFGVPVALALGVGFVPIRKPRKLPGAVVSLSYDLEYGSDTLEVPALAFEGRRRVLLVDDVLATGGTIQAGRDLVVRAGGEVVASAFLVELGFLRGRARLAPGEVFSLVQF